MSNKIKKKQVQNQAQDGRSMVEMLGVLAIIGVLSIGGISGYRMAMDRYQANQIANEINLMRTDAKVKAAAQVTGKLMLGEPYDSGHLNLNSHYGVEFDFAVFSEAGEPEESGYYIKVSGVPAGVCKPLVTLLEGMDDAIAVVVNNDPENDADSSADLCTEESNALEVDFSTKDLGGVSGGNSDPEVTDPDQGDEPHECDPETCPGTCNDEGVCECPEGSHLKGDECVTCSGGKVWDGNDCSCPAGAEKSGEDGEECACSTAKPHWNGTECTACPNGSTWDSTTGECKCEGNKVWKESVSGEDKCVEIVGECESNADCGPGEYCYLYYGYQCYDGKEFDSSKGFGAGHNKYTSECRKAESDISKSGDTNSKYIISTSSMTWWSAKRFCEALNKHMVTISELQCKHKIQYSGGDCTYGYCHDKDSTQTCTGGSNTELSEVIKELRKANDGNENSTASKYLWLSNPYGSSDSSCIAYGVTLDDGRVTGSSRYYYFYALCE